MPILHIHSNIPQDDTSLSEFSGKIVELLSKTLRKNSSYIQVLYTYTKIVFGSQKGPSALVELRAPTISQKQVDNLIPSISKLVERYIGAPAPSTYIIFQEIDRTKWVWNGRPLDVPKTKAT